MDIAKLTELERKLGVTFNDKSLLFQALTHRSYLNEHRDKKLISNERLEFIGDAVLELITSIHLFKKLPTDNEGILTFKRSAVVCSKNLLVAAQKLGIGDYIFFSRGEAKDEKGRARNVIVADTLEAIIGALYFDRGYEITEEFVHRVLLSEFKESVETSNLLDAKSKLQERTQASYQVTPVYKDLKEGGPDHDKRFTVGIFLNESLIAKGEGPSKQKAQQAAAERALKLV